MKKYLIHFIALFLAVSLIHNGVFAANNRTPVIPAEINDLATIGSRAANHKAAKDNCAPGTKLNATTKVCDLIKQGPFPISTSECKNGTFVYYKNLPTKLKSAHESNFTEWKNACKGLASCKHASEMTWHVTYTYNDTDSEAYGCIPKTCSADFPKKKDSGCEAYADKEECTPSDENAKKGVYNLANKTCEVTECKDKYDKIDGKCLSKKQQKAQEKAQSKEAKAFSKDVDALIDAYKSVTNKLVSECKAKGKSVKNGECEE